MGKTRSFLALLLAGVVTPAAAQRAQPDTAAVRDTIGVAPITVTATRSETSVFDVPTPVSVIGSATIRERAANSVADLVQGLAGVDVAGVGPSQARPIIRGQRGQRILLLEDGIRLNNSRRQSDFGEITSLVDLWSVDRVEVVRGPASVLYGSDAIGGVVNIITQQPRTAGLQATAGYRYSTHDDQQNVRGSVSGRLGRVAVRASGSYRDANPYDAPAGSFGDITLADAVRVEDSGVEDYSLSGYLGYQLQPGQDVFVKYERYSSDSAGFGFVDPAAYDPGAAEIEIRYPRQRFNKVSLGYGGVGVGLPFADKVDVLAYLQSNERQLSLDVFIPFGPGVGLDIAQRNSTDIETFGGRLELKKLVGSTVALTYGVDFFRDRTTNTDTSITAFVGGPPGPPDVSGQPQVPNASFRSLGAFFQSEFHPTSRLTFIVGGRYQDVNASTRETPGLTAPLIDATDRTVVGAANAILGITDELSVVTSVGRAFRSPNLIERFFNGATPEGFGFQSPNPDLEAETSLNVDLGLRYRNRMLSLEGFVFQNTIFDGIRIQETGDMVFGLPEFQNVNIDELRARGVELNGDLTLPVGVILGGNFTHLDTKNVTEDRNSPIGDSFSNQLVGYLRYQEPRGRFFGEYRVRHNFERDDPEIFPDNPLGDVLPAFTVHSLRAGATLFDVGPATHRVMVGVTNLTNELYAEFTNASFFRPEPRRSFTVSYDVTF